MQICLDQFPRFFSAPALFVVFHPSYEPRLYPIIGEASSTAKLITGFLIQCPRFFSAPAILVSCYHLFNVRFHLRLSKPHAGACLSELPVEVLETLTPSTHVVHNSVALDVRSVDGVPCESRSSKEEARISLKWRFSSATCSSAA